MSSDSGGSAPGGGFDALLPADIARELDDLLPEGDDAIWDDAGQIALDAVAGADA